MHSQRTKKGSLELLEEGHKSYKDEPTKDTISWLVQDILCFSVRGSREQSRKSWSAIITRNFHITWTIQLDLIVKNRSFASNFAYSFVNLNSNITTVNFCFW